ncbi:MAG: GNAT family N-acetyltransferase [Lutibacter sp.]|uniref:GNAT family N-acetyltransferase n=1 Tax=Lutibacter sp. TaxID=1925666 RepID=UPI00385F5C64
MIHNNFKIREIKLEDNPKIAQTIRAILIEFGVPKVGTAYADKILDTLYEAYLPKKAIYYVIEKDGEIFGGAGIKQLDNYKGNICELQKMYFLPEARGIGLGSKMIDICLQKAKEFGFKKCYLETLPYMKDARKLYKKVGFKVLDERIGDTCHYSCNVWMLKDL